MEKRQLLDSVYHGQQPPEGWEDHHRAWSFVYIGRRGLVDLSFSDDMAPVTALYRAVVDQRGFANARRAGWAV